VALESIGDSASVKRFEHAIVRFAYAVDMVSIARQQWNDAGKPAIIHNPNGIESIHPLVKLIESSEAAAARAGRALQLEPDALKVKGKPGRPPGASSSRDKLPPPMVTIAKHSD
jgi:hypothetical protein